MLKWVSDGENLKVSKSKIVLSDELASQVLRNYIHPYTLWRNKLTVLELERRLKMVMATNTKPFLPWYMGFSHFERDNEWIVFLRWPMYYRRSWRLRLTQLRQRFGRFIQNIGNRIAQ